jgi:hypothetical protein
MKSSTLGAALIAACAACAPEPAPTTPAPGGGLAPPATASAQVTAAPSAPSAPAPPATPDDVVTQGRAAFDACYAQARTLDPKLGRTKVEMTFVIDADGKPRTVDLKYRHRMEDRAKDCMRDAGLALHFPASMQGTQTATILFSPPAP